MLKLLHMNAWQKNIRRVAIDAAGYLLIVAAVLTGWLPGPGGIPLAIAGLGLLSIHNVWAQRLRDYILAHGGKIVKLLFPDNRLVQIAYDVLVVLLWLLASVLIWRRSALWQISLAVALFFISLFIALMNRDRLTRLKNHS